MTSISGALSPTPTMNIADIPLLPPPAGVVPNFVNPPTRAPLVIGLCAVCIALVWIVYPWRMFTKAFVTNGLWWDDLTVTLAVIGTTGFAASVIWTQKFLGPHSWDIRLISIPGYYEQISLGGILLTSCLTAMFTKLSLLLLYLRIFRPSRWMRICFWIGTMFNIVLYLGSMIGYAAACVKRPNETWVEDQTSDRCLRDTAPAGWVLGIAGLLSDIYLFVLPIPAVWQLQMPRKRKIAVTLLFAVALLAPICSAFGLYFRIIENMNLYGDAAWNLGLADAVSVIEVAVGIVVCCVPYLPPSLKNGQLAKYRTSLRNLFTRTTRRSDSEPRSDQIEVLSK